MNETTFHTIAVGQQFINGMTSFAEGSRYNYMKDQHTFLVFVNHPTPSEIAEFKEGRIELALVSLGDAIVLCARFGRLAWSDAPYSWHLNEADARTLPQDEDFPAGTGVLLLSILVDTSTGIVAAIRGTFIGHQFTLALNAAIREQAAKRWCGHEMFSQQLENVYSRYRKTRGLLQIARCKWRQTK